MNRIVQRLATVRNYLSLSVLVIGFMLQALPFQTAEARTINASRGSTVNYTVNPTSDRTINHYANFRNDNTCPVHIQKVTKSWTSTGGVLLYAEEVNKSGKGPRYHTANGSFTVNLKQLLGGDGLEVAGRSTKGQFILDHRIKKGTPGTVTSTFTFEYTSSCGHNCSASGSATSIFNLPDPNCKKADFAKGSAKNGETVKFEWNVENPGGQVRLICSGAGVSIDKNVSASGNQNVTVPNSANDNARIACNIRVGSTSLCSDELQVVGTPSIRIRKTDKNNNDQDGSQGNDSQRIDEGDTARFEITVTNNGTEPLKNVVISDPEARDCYRSASQTQGLYPGSTFTPGASFKYTCTKTNVRSNTFADGDNDISVTAKGNRSNKNVNDADPSSVVLVVPPANGAISILKWANNPNDKDGKPSGNDNDNDSQSINSGSNVIFRIEVKNTGPVALENVLVNDANTPQCALNANQVREILTTGSASKSSISGVSKLSGTNSNNTLGPNEGFQYNCTQPNVVDGYTNTAVTQGDPTNGTSRVSDSDDSEVLICDLPDCPPVGSPSIEIIKTDVNTNDQDNVQRNDTQTIDAGDEAVFEITVTNNGREALVNVVVDDPEAPNCNRSASQTQALYPGSLFDRGESFTYTCTRNNVSETTFPDNDNDAFVTARGHESGTNVNDDDPTTIVLSPVVPICGNGQIEAPEECDNGALNGTPGNLCSAICTDLPTPVCSSSSFVPTAVAPGRAATFNWNSLNFTGDITLTCWGPAINNFTETVNASDSREVTTLPEAANGATATCSLKNYGMAIPSCDATLTVDTSINPFSIDILKWARNDADKDDVKTGNNAANDSQTVESIPDNGLDKAIFRIRVENDGIASLKNVRVHDANAPVCALNQAQVAEILTTGTSSKAGISGVGLINTVTSNDILEPGEGFVYNCTLDDVRDSFTNTARAVATPVNDSTDVNDQDDSAVIVDNTCVEPDCPTPGGPDIQIVKTDENPADFDNTQGNDIQLIGDNTTAVFRITVTNNGGESLKSVIVSDQEALNCERTAAETAALYPGTHFDRGESFSYTCEKPNAQLGDFDGANGQGSVDGSNDARVDAMSAVDDDPVDDQDPSRVDFIGRCTPAQGQITINKDDSTPGLPDTDGDDRQVIPSGGTAEFTITVANNGSTTLERVSVEDALSPSCARSVSEFMTLLGGEGNNDDKLDAGESVTYTCTQTNVTADYTNSATVNGLNQAIPCAVTDTDTTEVVVSGGGGFCGDGIIQTPEECDNGPSNGTAGNSCSATCTDITGGCTGPGCGSGSIDRPSVGVCDVHPSTFAPVCTRKRADDTVLTDPDWITYRECVANSNPVHPLTPGMTIAEACTLDYMAAKGESRLCGAQIGLSMDPFAPASNAEAQAQCGVCVGAGCGPTPPPCTPMPTPCAGCFNANTGITKTTLTPIVAANESATYEIDVVLDGFDTTNYQVVSGHVRVYDQIVSTESGNMWYKDGIIDGDGNGTWVWCNEPANLGLCNGEAGEYFRIPLVGSSAFESWDYLTPINTSGRADLKLPYDVNTTVWGAFDTSRVKNVAYAVVYYDYVALDPITGNPTGPTLSNVGGIGARACDATTLQNALSLSSVGSTATVDIIRPFVQAKAGNAGYFSDNEDKAFADQAGIQADTGLLTPTVLNQGLTITGSTDLDVYDGEQVGDADEIKEFQDQKDDFYDNVSDAISGPVSIGTETFQQVGNSPVYQFAGRLDIATLASVSESATFIISDKTDGAGNVIEKGDLVVSSDFEITGDKFMAFIVRHGDLLIDKAVKDMDGMYLIEQGEIKSMADEISYEQLKVSGNLYGDLGHLLAYRRYIGSGVNIEPSVEINFDLRLLEFTPPMLQQFLGEGWEEAVQQ